MKIKCGTVAVIGNPNAGKSSLINAVIKEKVSIVSPKPQTTRNNILGILTNKDCQIVFVDTPGINRTDSKLGKFMQKGISSALDDVDVVCFVHDITKPLKTEEINIIRPFFDKIPVVFVLSKADLLAKEQIISKIVGISNLLSNKCEIVPISSLKNKNLTEFLDVIKGLLPETEDKLFSDDFYTDRSLKFIACEIVREKALYFLQDEVPHDIAVVCENYADKETICDIDVLIVCQKQSQKGIILGKGGEMLKKIGHSARVSIQKIVRKKVNLNIYVKVRPNWKNDLEFLGALGYNENEI